MLVNSFRLQNQFLSNRPIASSANDSHHSDTISQTLFRTDRVHNASSYEPSFIAKAIGPFLVDFAACLKDPNKELTENDFEELYDLRTNLEALDYLRDKGIETSILPANAWRAAVSDIARHAMGERRADPLVIETINQLRASYKAKHPKKSPDDPEPNNTQVFNWILNTTVTRDRFKQWFYSILVERACKANLVKEEDINFINTVK